MITYSPTNEFEWQVSVNHGYLDRYTEIILWLFQNVKDDRWKLMFNYKERTVSPRFKDKETAMLFLLTWRDDD